jgi:hypothetical protein
MRDERRSPWPNFGSRHSCPSVAVYAVIPDGGNRHNGMSAICAKRPSADWVLTLALLWQIYSSDLRRVRLQCGHR